MEPARALLARARASGKASLAVVGTSKNAGKSTAVAALCDALGRDGATYGLCSIGRDGEAIDALEGSAKPRFFLRPGAFVATASSLLPRSPACEIVAVTGERSAVGRIVVARVRAPGFFEIAGPPTASGSRRIVDALRALAGFVILDGAVDRLAALRGGDDAIVVASGVEGEKSVDAAIASVAALVRRLRLPLVDADEPAVHEPGALSAARAAEFVRAGERRQIVVRDGTYVTFGGGTFDTFASRLRLRCETELVPIACTIAPLSPRRSKAYDALTYARGVAGRTKLPVYDFYRGFELVPA